jgi:hypothetical protein
MAFDCGVGIRHDGNKPSNGLSSLGFGGGKSYPAETISHNQVHEALQTVNPDRRHGLSSDRLEPNEQVRRAI